MNENIHIAATHSVTIGDDVLMASRIYISDHHHGDYSGEVQSSPDIPPNDRLVTADAKVVVGDRVWIGEMVSILAGVTIGEGSIVGSGSVVTKDIPPNCIAVGSPARVIKRFDFLENKWVTVTRL
jgi:lipopolysaccharide O-acetyltransferase